MNKNDITIDDIENEIRKARLDTEFREAIAHSMMALGYVNDSPLNLSFGTPEQQKELRKIETSPLNSNQLSEMIHLMMYEMRDDFQYAGFRPIVLNYLNIAKEMRKTEQNNKEDAKLKEKPKCNMNDAFGIVKKVGLASQTLKKNNMFNASREMIERATESYSYADAMDIINEYVEIIEREEFEEKKENEEELEQ